MFTRFTLMVAFSKAIRLIVVVKRYLKLTAAHLLSEVGALKSDVDGDVETRGDGLWKIFDAVTRGGILELNAVVILTATQAQYCKYRRNAHREASQDPSG